MINMKFWSRYSNFLAALAVSVFAYFHTSTIAYSAEDATPILPVIPQPTKWKPEAGECDLASAKVEVKVDASSVLGEEGYTMKIAPGAITVVAGGDTGAVWAEQTLAQLKASGAKAKCGTIRDIPKYRADALDEATVKYIVLKLLVSDARFS